MSRLAMCGWESGFRDEIGFFSAGGTAPNSSTWDVSSVARNGNYALKLAYYGNNNTACYAMQSILIPNLPDRVFARLGMKRIREQSMGSTDNCVDAFLDLMHGTTRQLGLAVDMFGAVRLYRGTTNIDGGGQIPTTNFACVEMDAYTHATSGWARVLINGVQVINFTGDTLESTVAAFSHVDIGAKRIVNGTGGNAVVYGGYFDDFALNNTSGTINNGQIGQGGIVAMRPTVDTADKDWGRSAGSDNYALVDDAPLDGDSTYITGTNSGDLDLYEHGDIAAGGTVDAVQVAFGQRVSAGAGRTVAPALRAGATTAIGSGFSATNTYGFGAQIWETNPDTAAAWALLAVNSLQAGVALTN